MAWWSSGWAKVELGGGSGSTGRIGGFEVRWTAGRAEVLNLAGGAPGLSVATVQNAAVISGTIIFI